MRLWLLSGTALALAACVTPADAQPSRPHPNFKTCPDGTVVNKNQACPTPQPPPEPDPLPDPVIKECPDGSVILAEEPCPPEPPPPDPEPEPDPTPDPPPHDHGTPPLGQWIPSPSLDGGPGTPATFDVSLGLQTITATSNLYGGGKGAFRLTCSSDEWNYDDEIIGLEGKSHIHEYFNCNAVAENRVNPSRYWFAAMTDGENLYPAQVVALYYKQLQATDPKCNEISRTDLKAQGICLPLPNDIRFIFGWDAYNPDAPVSGRSWYVEGCSKHGPDINAALNACPTLNLVGRKLVGNLVGPSCWDGKNLDSPNHRAHLAYGSYGSWGYYRCPASHPYVIPTTEYKPMWTITEAMLERMPDGTVRSRLKLVSDRHADEPGYTLHGDYRPKWIREVLLMWHNGCIAKGLSCNNGDLGNDFRVPGAWGKPVPPAVMPIPPRP